MLTLSKSQKSHTAKVIKTKRKQMFGYPGGNRELAARLGISPQLLSMWAYNKRSPCHKDLLTLAEAFNISLNELCHLGETQKGKTKKTAKQGHYAVSPADARKSMLEICNITTEIVKRQRQMLTGNCNYKMHNDWLRRIKNYVDTM